mgnify:CR=1 FL=1
MEQGLKIADILCYVCDQPSFHNTKRQITAKDAENVPQCHYKVSMSPAFGGGPIHRKRRLGGLLNYYYLAVA